MSSIQRGYELAKELYAQAGVDVDAAIRACDRIPLSVHCWQCDDGMGLEGAGRVLSGGIQVTGNHPGRARGLDGVLAYMEQAFRLIPGVKKANIHAIYLDNGGRDVDRDAIEPAHFDGWIDWANGLGIGLDFNGTFYSHPRSEDGATLSSADDGVRAFWVEHGRRTRVIAAHMARRTGKPVVLNTWIPDGEKEVPVDTLSPRLRLMDSLDAMLAAPHDNVIDAVESKLFGLGSEAYVAGSHEFYMGYCLSRQNAYLTLDTGHFHPTETVSAKLSALYPFVRGLLLHVSRPVRWDSDHVVAYDDETRAIMAELVRLDAWDRTCVALDYFDGSIDRVTALAVGARNTRKALLEAFLQPVERFREIERAGDRSLRLVRTQEWRTMPFSLVWDYYCESNGIPPRL